MSIRKDCAPLSEKAVAQLAQLRKVMTFEELAEQIPCSPATIWKASASGAVARVTKFFIELRLDELIAARGAER